MEIYRHEDVHANVPEPPKKQKNSGLSIATAVLLCVCVFLSVVAVCVSFLWRDGEILPPTQNYESAFKKVRDSVVEVRGSGTAGSGIVYKIRGGKTYVMTNKHVIGEDASADVIFSDHGERVPGAVLGYDEYHDIALLEIEGYHGVVAVTAGNRPDNGVEVLAVGNNLGYGIAAYDGIISRNSRMLKISSANKTVPVYAVTCPVNAGMSGGGLFTLDGKIIGINTYQTHTINGGSRPVDGVSYSVPYSIADKIARHILDNGSVGQIERIYIEGGLSEKEVDFIGLYFRAEFGSAGFKISALTYGVKPDEIRGDINVGDIITRIGDLEITGATGYDEIYAETLSYVPDDVTESRWLELELFDGEKTRVVKYYAKRLKYA